MLNFNFLNMYKDKLEDHLYGYISVEEIEDIRNEAEGLYLQGHISYEDYHGVAEDIEATLLYA